MDTAPKIHASIGLEPYATRISMRGHVITGDETHENGGKDLGPTPTELVLSGLAACTASTLKMYADRKGWLIERINVEITIHTDKHADGTQTAHIKRVLHFEGTLTDEQKERLIQIAEKCPIHRLLTNNVEINTTAID
jgi:putative redox protein